MTYMQWYYYKYCNVALDAAATVVAIWTGGEIRSWVYANIQYAYYWCVCFKNAYHTEFPEFVLIMQL